MHLWLQVEQHNHDIEDVLNTQHATQQESVNAVIRFDLWRVLNVFFALFGGKNGFVLTFSVFSNV
jgi:hypothetical protein